jgi:hypothetical protein
MTAGTRYYTMGSDEEVARDLGEMQGDNATLTVTGNNFAVHGNGYGGVTINDDDTFILDNVSSWSGFDGTSITNAGTLRVNSTTTNTEFGEQLTNTGTMELTGSKTIEFKDALTGADGETTIDSTGTVKFDSTLQQNKLTITSGSVEVKASDIDVTNTIDNSGTIKLGAGELRTGIKGSTGSVETTGDVTLTKSIVGNALDISTHALTIAAGGSLDVRAFTNGDGATFDSSNNNRMDEIKLGSANIAKDLSSTIDVDLENITADKFIATMATGNGKISIDNLNVTGESEYRHTHVNVANDVIKDYVTQTVNETGVYTLRYSDGDLIFKNAGIETLVSAVRDGDSAEYNLEDTENIADGVASYENTETPDERIGTLAQDLVVNGNGNSIDGAEMGGILIDSNKTLSINNVSDADNFDGDFVDNESGTLNITDSKITSGITNNKTLNI